MAVVTRTTVWIDNQVLTASALNGEFNNLLNALALSNSDIAGGAGIVFSKLDSGTVAGVTQTQTLTNKTLTSPTLNKPTINASVQGVTVMSAQALDGSTNNVFTRTLAGSETFTQSNFSTGQFFIVEVTQGSGTTYTVTWFSGVTWVTSGGTAPTQTTTSNGVTTYGFRCTGTNTFLGYLVGTN